MIHNSTKRQLHISFKVGLQFFHKFAMVSSGGVSIDADQSIAHASQKKSIFRCSSVYWTVNSRGLSVETAHNLIESKFRPCVLHSSCENSRTIRTLCSFGNRQALICPKNSLLKRIEIKSRVTNHNFQINSNTFVGVCCDRQSDFSHGIRCQFFFSKKDVCQLLDTNFYPKFPYAALTYRICFAIGKYRQIKGLTL